MSAKVANLAKAIENGNNHKRRKRVKREDILDEQWGVSRTRHYVCELAKDGARVPFQFCHSTVRGFLIRSGPSGAFVELYEAPDKDLPQRWVPAYISNHTRVYKLRRRRNG